MDKQTQKNLLKIVKRNYEEIAENFSETRKKYLWPELMKLTQNVKKGDKVLDVGCGNGRLLQAFKSKQIKYVGIDSSEKLIQIAKTRNTEHEIQNKEFMVRDILELNKIAQINFDYVFCIAVLHQIPGKDLQIQALKQLKNKVKFDGEIIITVWNLWSWKKFRKLIWKFVSLKLIGKSKMDYGDIFFDWKNSKGERVSQRYYHVFTKSGLKKIIKKAGLKVEKIYKDKYNYCAILKK